MAETILSGKLGFAEQFDVEELEFFRRLIAAVQNNEFVVYFQPKVSITDMKIAGAEALIRWNCNGSVLPPVKFIPFCERTGLVVDIDFFVLEETCRAMRRWIDEGIEPVRISVNFSRYHFNQDGIAEKIYQIIAKYGIPTQYIEVEFTETAYLDKEELLEYTVEKLKSFGIKSSIDDFGSGYSSINLLQNMDFQVVKLDKSLLGKGVENEKTQKVISSIIHMAKELEMEVLAEGVETKEEFELLRDLDCDIVQGFLFDKPMPADEFEKRLKGRCYTIDGNIKQLGDRMELKDVEIEEIELSTKKSKKSEKEKEKSSKPETEAYHNNRYMEFSPEVKSDKKNMGMLIAGVVLMLVAITVLAVTVLLASSGRIKANSNSDSDEVMYTQSEVDAIVDEKVTEAEDETRTEVEEEYKSKIHEAAEVAGGMVNFIRSLFPDEMVFINGYKFSFVPINKDLKMSTIEAAKFVTDEETGFMYYTDDQGNRTSYVGIDVSSFQGDIDWQTVKDSGVDFAIIRCGIRGYGSEGHLVEDSSFEKNIEGATAAGINVGVYFYTQALNVEEATEEAEFVISIIEPYDFTGPVILDVESASSEERIKNITNTERTDCIIAFCDRIKQEGYEAMIYADVKYFTMKMEIERLEDYEKWYANYNGLSIGEDMSVWSYSNPFMFPYEFKMWQYSNTGSVPGVDTEVDLDVLFDKWW